jgi:hypothetical protein
MIEDVKLPRFGKRYVASAPKGEWRLLKTIRPENHWGFLDVSDLK